MPNHALLTYLKKQDFSWPVGHGQPWQNTWQTSQFVLSLYKSVKDVSTFYKIKEGNQKNPKHFPNSLGECPFLCLYVSLWLAQSHTPLNTAVFMAFCNSGEQQIKKERNVEKNESWGKELKQFKHRPDENTETQMVREEGRAGHRKRYTVCSIVRHDCLSCPVFFTTAFHSLPLPTSSLPLQFGW